MKNRRLVIFLSVLSTICFVLFATCVSIEKVAYDNMFYYQQMDELEVADTLGVSGKDLEKIVDHTIDYLKGKKQDFQFQVSINGKVMNVYEQNEVDHMVDVQKLFNACTIIKWVCLALFIFSVVLIYMIGKWYAIRLWGSVTLITMLAIGLFLGVIVGWYLLDFSSFWTFFHKVFFRNDLWLMQPTDRMILMFPAEFFSTVVMRISIILGTYIGGLLLAAFSTQLFIKKKRGKSFG